MKHENKGMLYIIMSDVVLIFLGDLIHALLGCGSKIIYANTVQLHALNAQFLFFLLKD